MVLVPINLLTVAMVFVPINLLLLRCCWQLTCCCNGVVDNQLVVEMVLLPINLLNDSNGVVCNQIASEQSVVLRDLIGQMAEVAILYACSNNFNSQKTILYIYIYIYIYCM